MTVEMLTTEGSIELAIERNEPLNSGGAECEGLTASVAAPEKRTPIQVPRSSINRQSAMIDIRRKATRYDKSALTCS